MRPGMSLQDTKIPRSAVGFSIALQGNALIVAGYPKTKELLDGFNGKVYIYKRVQPGEPFLPEQIIEDPQSHIGDGFGYSISVHSNTLAVDHPIVKADLQPRG